MTTVWVAQRYGVRESKVVAVLPTREATEELAASTRPDADGYHSWLFTEVEMGRAPTQEELGQDYPVLRQSTHSTADLDQWRTLDWVDDRWSV